MWWTQQDKQSSEHIEFLKIFQAAANDLRSPGKKLVRGSRP
jgi:hypothetical protein